LRIRFAVSRLDLLLVGMTLIWGSNFSIAKAALRELPAPAFNGVRMLIAATVCAGLVAREGGLPALRRFSAADWRRIGALAVLGHCVYQYLFIGGLARTSASNSSLIFGCTPAIVALCASWLGHERVTATRWAGVVLSMAGVYLVVGHGHDPSASILGDALIGAAMIAWALYTVGSRPLLDRHSPVLVTALGMILGGLLYAGVALPVILGVAWGGVRPAVWIAVLYSALFSLVVAYLIWYVAVQRVGSSRTSVYSNVTPIVAMGVAAVFLGEPITAAKAVGAVAVLGGVAVTRLEFGPRAEGPSEG
jgi:drug/metabolite transporter (DMT)-like permease